LAGSLWRLAGILLVLFFFILPRSVRAEGSFSLTTGYHPQGEWTSRLRGEISLKVGEMGRLALTASIPQKIKSGEEAYADLALSFPGDPWHWTGRFRLLTTPAGTEGFFQLRGTYYHREGGFLVTMGELDLNDPSRERGI